MTTIGTTEKNRNCASSFRTCHAARTRHRGALSPRSPWRRAGHRRALRPGWSSALRTPPSRAPVPPPQLLQERGAPAARDAQAPPARPGPCRASCTIRPAWWSVWLGLRWIAAITPQRSARMVTLRSRSLGASARSAYVQAALRRRARCRSASGRAAARTGPRRRSRPARARRARRSRRGAATRSRPCSCAGGRVAGPGRACRR